MGRGQHLMIRRWLIRGFFILLLAASIEFWMWSYAREFRVDYVSKSSNMWSATFLRSGRLGFFQVEVAFVPPAVRHPGWRFTFDAHELAWDDWDNSSAYRFWGFSYTPPNTLMSGVITSRNGTIPCWFLTLLLAVPLWIAWRKTKVKLKSFPIEPTTEAKSPAT